MRYVSDGPFTINPAWKSVLAVDEVVNKNKPLFINDTLVLYFTSVESYDQALKLIDGSYSRLILYGPVTWPQVKQLLHANVKQVRIMGNVDVKLMEYDSVVNTVRRFGSGCDYK
uniref:Recep_L_domain domain-containing protein n=1 Tax=Panagrellus redivivus TaxID=6233 RepID=A0A7E4VAF7_PANRE